MRFSNLFGRTLREAPTEALTLVEQLAVRAGLVRTLTPGSLVLLPLGLAALRRIEQIIERELAQLGAQEVRLPLVQPAYLWEQCRPALSAQRTCLPATDHNERPLLVAPGQMLALAELARRELSSYRQLPALVYQFAPRYHDEARPQRGWPGLRETTQLELFWLSSSASDQANASSQLAALCERIMQHCGLVAQPVLTPAELTEATSQDYLVSTPNGESQMLSCGHCGTRTSPALAALGWDRVAPPDQPPAPPAEEVATPGTSTIAELAAYLKLPEAATAKAVFFDTPERGLIFVVIRGDLEVNPAKLCQVAAVSSLRPASLEQIAATGAVPGYASPVGLPDCYVLADHSVVAAGPLVAGANRMGYHLRNVVYGRDWQASQVADLALARPGDPCAGCGHPLRSASGLRVGTLTSYGPGLSRLIGANVLDEQGTSRPILINSCQLALEALLYAIIGQAHDERGLVWPAQLAPADVQIIALGKSAAPKEAATQVASTLQAAGLRTLLDDRDESAGVKFNDADLIGLPLRLVVSERLLASDELELKPRQGEAARIPRATLLEAVQLALT